MTTTLYSNLTDEQWGRVAATAFPNGPPSAARAVINAVRFREVARLPWGLLPPAFPPPDEVRTTLAGWKADGTWRRITAVCAPPARSVQVPPPRLRSRIARVLEAVPGGRAVLLPARRLIRLTDRLRARWTPTARLPQLYVEARERHFATDFAGAAARYAEILALDPTNAPVRVEYGWALLHLNRHEAAEAEFLAVLSAGVHPDPWWARANDGLARVYLHAGDLDRAIGHRYASGLAGLTDTDRPPTDPNLEPEEYEQLAAAHLYIAEDAINSASDFALAAQVYRRVDVVRARYAAWLATVPGNTLYLQEDWVRNIGHTALVDIWLKAVKLGWRAADRLVLLAPPGRTANPALARCYRPHVTVISDPRPDHPSRHLATALGPRVASQFALPDGSSRYFLEAIGAVQEAWERAGRAPLVTLSADDRAAGAELLRNLGVPAGKWFAVLHVRSPGFHKDFGLAYQTHRDADIATYLPAVREVTARGGWVVRVGDASMPPVPPTPGLVDYARSKHKSDGHDVFLCGAARFFIGVASGLSHVPTVFGVPCVLTNWISNALPVYSRNDVFIPKRVRADGRVLTFDEWLTRDTRLRCVLGTEMQKAGLEAIDNTPAELRAVVVEMLDRLDGRFVETPDDVTRQERFAALARAHGLIGFPRIGRDFLAAHAALLPAEHTLARAG